MNIIYCKHHPTAPARWACDKCGIDLCSSCIKQDYLPDPVVVCPICDQNLRSLGSENSIVPFWLRIPRFFLFPINTSSLLYIGALSLVSIVTFQPSLIGMLIQLAIFMVFLKYAYSVLARQAAGYDNPPEINTDMINQGLELPFKQVGVFILIGLVGGTVYEHAGPAIAGIYEIIISLIIPATVMVIAIDNSFLRAINPIFIFSIIRRIGWPYLILCVFLAILQGSVGLVLSLFGHPESFLTALFIFNIFSMYFLLIMFNMMGYAIYQHHEALGYPIEIEPDEQNREANKGPTKYYDGMPNEIEVLIKEGQTAKAIDRLKVLINAQPSEISYYRLLHKLAMMAHDKVAVLDNGENLISRLIEFNYTGEAAGVIVDIMTLQPSFQLENADRIYPLAKQLASTGKGQHALNIINGHAQRFPHHPDIPRLYLLAAKILCETLKKDSKAKGLLTSLLRTYPKHKLAPEIESYLEVVNKLSIYK